MDYLLEDGGDFPLPKLISLDQETTGLMPYHGDKIFAISISDGMNNYYIKVKDSVPPWLVDYLDDPTNCIVGHNIKFDLHFFAAQFNIFPKCTVIDTLSLARLEYNDHLTYSLSACAKRIGLEKDDAVEKYITEHKLWEWEEIPGKKVRRKKKFFEKVPFDIMFRYACMDAEVTYKLYQHLTKRISQIDALLPDAPKLAAVAEQESELIKVVQDMESYGLKADLEYGKMAMEFYSEEAKNAQAEFKNLTGFEYKSSPKLFAEIFASEKEKWAYTEKGNPSFDSDSIKQFDNPAAKQILILRDAKSRADFFASFEYFADSENFIHPSFNQSGTASGRFSSSEPNFQNLTNDEEAEEGTLGVRAAIIPPSADYCIVSLDYDQQEYRMMLDYAGESELIEQVKNGVDVHQATAELMGVSRKYAKTLNFMLLYGGGVAKLAEALDIPEWEARDLKNLYFSKLPKVQKFIDTVIRTAKQRGYVYNWMGRRYFCDPNYAYKMPNRVIQGGGADVMKLAMCRISKILKGTKSTMFMTVHDELNFYVHKDELYLVEDIKKIMESSYPPKNLPLTVSVSHSWENLGALVDGPPAPKEAARHRSNNGDRARNKAKEIPGGGSKLSGNGFPGGYESLFKVFGLKSKDVAGYKKFRVEESLSSHCFELYGETEFSASKLAVVDRRVLLYQAESLRVNLDAYK